MVSEQDDRRCLHIEMRHKKQKHTACLGMPLVCLTICSSCFLTRVASTHVLPVRPAHKAMTGTDRKRKTCGTGDLTAKARKQDSHLYTDDNPSTTLHGTGFQDAAVAEKTIDLVKKRSLTYQFQVVNTMFHRAKHHPHPNARMEGAMEVFSKWLAEYPVKKKHLPDFKKASRAFVQTYLEAIERQQLQPDDAELVTSEPFEQALTWARMYVAMPTGKRLANTLTCADPQEPDMESLRLVNLQELVPQDSTQRDSRAWRLTDGNCKQVSDLHLQWILWGYTPAEKQAMTTLQALISKMCQT